MIRFAAVNTDDGDDAADNVNAAGAGARQRRQDIHLSNSRFSLGVRRVRV